MTETLQLETWQDEVHRPAREPDAVVLAHNYMPAPIQDVADVVGDSLALARHAAATDTATIGLCGVVFMAETAKILDLDKTVLVPTGQAGCSLADGITADDVRRWRAGHPGAVVVAYVNTTAAVKAEADLCCTSASAVEVVSSIPEDRPVLFLPDQLRRANTGTTSLPMNQQAWCRSMKMSTPELLLRCLREGRDEVVVEPALAARARAAVEAMLDLGKSGAGE